MLIGWNSPGHTTDQLDDFISQIWHVSPQNWYQCVENFKLIPILITQHHYCQSSFKATTSRSKVIGCQTHASTHLHLIGDVHTEFRECSSNIMDTAGTTWFCGGMNCQNRQTYRQTDTLISIGHPQYLCNPKDNRMITLERLFYRIW